MITIEELLNADSDITLKAILSNISYIELEDLLFDFFVKVGNDYSKSYVILEKYPQSYPIFEDCLIYLYDLNTYDSNNALIVNLYKSVIAEVDLDYKRVFSKMDEANTIFVMVAEQLYYHRKLKTDFLTKVINEAIVPLKNIGFNSKEIQGLVRYFYDYDAIEMLVPIKKLFPNEKVLSIINSKINEIGESKVVDGMIALFPEIYEIAINLNKKSEKKQSINSYDYLENIELDSINAVDEIVGTIIKNKKELNGEIPLRIIEFLEEIEVFEWIGLLVNYPDILNLMETLTMNEIDYLNNYRAVPKKVLNKPLYKDNLSALENSGRLSEGVLIKMIKKHIGML